MNPNVFVSIPEQPFLLVLWIMMCYTLVFVFILELLVTIWVIAEFRFRRHKQTVEQKKQDLELERLQQQTTGRVPVQRNPPSSAVKRPARRSTTNQDDWR